MTYGPNTNVSSGGSIIWCAETAGRYIGQCVTAMVRGGLKEISVKPKVHDDYNDFITQELKWTAWDDPGCVSWYKQARKRGQGDQQPPHGPRGVLVAHAPGKLG